MLEKQFEEFLVAHFNQWATNEIKVGFRYQFTCLMQGKGTNFIKRLPKNHKHTLM
ncbi:hypothetical protein [Pseudoalteromonas luteoviolacea]|uniref:hypothetical protein n=1 Tax=Pseudoalteromonas luteoviolacea TaxID=43657 RepID=UPI0026CD4C5F